MYTRPKSYDKEEMATGYRVVNMISVETFNVSLLGKVIDVAVANGANQLHGVTFGLEANISVSVTVSVTYTFTQ